jgi:polyhydroxybutyrate depolymerase
MGTGVGSHRRAGPGRRGWALPLGIMAATALVAAACGGSGASAPSTTPPSSAPTPTTAAVTSTPTTAAVTSTSSGGSVAPAPSPGCGTAATAGTSTLDQNQGGRQRTAVVHLPTGYRPSSPIPLVLNMHGSQSTALQQEVVSGMDATADQDTFIVVYPQGGIPSGSGFEWNVPGEPLLGGGAVPAGAPDDVTYLEGLVHTLEQRYCVDQRRVYATGFSGGARMASQLGCDASGLIAAIAPVSGLRLPSPCPSTRPVPVVAFHGTADPVDPYAGNGQKYWTYSVPVAAQRWAAHNGCATAPTVTQPDGGVRLTSYGNCGGGSAVELYSITGEGHEWPGGPKLPRSLVRALGPQSSAVDANAVMWAFFVAHPLA